MNRLLSWTQCFYTFQFPSSMPILFSFFLESGIGTDISSGEDHGIRYDQSERGIAFTRQPAINESNLFNDTISTDVS